jgi:hypothetical protein
MLGKDTSSSFYEFFAFRVGGWYGLFFQYSTVYLRVVSLNTLQFIVAFKCLTDKYDRIESFLEGDRHRAG